MAFLKFATMKFLLSQIKTFLAITLFFGIGSFLFAQDTLIGSDSLLNPDSLVESSKKTNEIPASSPIEIELDFSESGIHFFNLSSPYHTVLSHLYFLQEEHYSPDSAAMTLNGVNPKTPEGQEKAIKLKQFLDGAGYFIDLDAIPREGDFKDSTSGYSKYVLVPAEPTIYLYKRGDKWVYSTTTVNAIDALFARVFPLGTFDWLPDWAQKRFLGFHLWQFLGVLIFILLTVLLHKLLRKVIGGILEFSFDRIIKKDHAVEFFTKVANPISLLILFYVLQAIYPALQFPIGLNRWVVAGFNVMIPVFWMLIALQVVNLVMAYMERKAAETEGTLDDQLVPLVRNLLKGIVVIMFIVLILDLLHFDITALVGGVAFGSLALALAAQDTVKNLFGSLLIFVDRPFLIGDYIIVDGHEGVVEEVSVRSTRIRTFANSLITIPNGNIASSPIDNMGVRVFRRMKTHIGVTYDTPPDLIEIFVEGIRELIKNHPTTRKDVFEVNFDAMGDSSLQILLYVFFAVPGWSEELAGRQSLLLSIMRLAETLGISFAFPTQTLHIENFPEKKSLTPVHPHSSEEYRAKMLAFLEAYKQEE